MMREDFKRNMRLTVIQVMICSAFVSFYVAAKEKSEKTASSYTKEIHRKVLDELPFSDRRDFENAKKGFIAPLNHAGIVKTAHNQIVFHAPSYHFKEDAPAPETVNPSLWRKAQLNGISGLFKVTDRIYQIRGQDISNLTVIEGNSGLIIIDPLVSKETAVNALETYLAHRPKRPVKAVIHTHSHIDHYGGVKGIVSVDDVQSGKVRIIAPEGFLEESVRENVLAGLIMRKRGIYSYGLSLPVGPTGNVGNGLGPSPSRGSGSLLAPTDIITGSTGKMVIDGLEFEFMLAPDSEAPAEMHFFIPELKALCTAENCVHTLHNFYTLRGAQNRDSQKWVSHLNKTLDLWGAKAEVLFAPHNIPVWGNAEIVRHIENYRDTMRFIHDCTVNLMNKGYKFNDIGNLVKLPESLARNWSARDYYGSVSHNARAVYNFYIGFFDGNPANLNPYSAVDEGRRYVAAFGRDKIFEAAQTAFQKGDYRWSAELLKHLINANPADKAARLLQADAFEQLGYQTECATWRGFYLVGAQELRNFSKKDAYPTHELFSSDVLDAMTVEMMLDHLASRLDYTRATGKNISVKFVFGNSGDELVLTLKNNVLNYRKKNSSPVDSIVCGDRVTVLQLLYGGVKLENAVKRGKITVFGKNPDALNQILAVVEPYRDNFSVILPVDAGKQNMK